MTRANKVLWTEGMFLQPQHFQQHDRYLAQQQQSRFRAVAGHGWGFLSLTLDASALQIGKVAIESAEGVLPDGYAFGLPGQDALPASLDVPPDARDELVVLAMPMAREGVAESDAECEATAAPPRFRAAEIEVGDSNVSGVRAAPLQVGRAHLRLMLARDVADGYVALGVCRVVERRADQRLVLDANYIAPMLDAAGSPQLCAHLRELHGMLHQRGEALAARLGQPGRAGSGEVADFLLLQTINRHEPLVAQWRETAVLHPRELYFEATALAGELTTFRPGRRPASLPAYLHDDVQRCFQPLMADLRQSLSTVLEQTAIPIELQERKYGIRVAVLPDAIRREEAQFVLAVSAQVPGDLLRARFPAQVKVGGVERIRDLVNLQLPGVPLRPLAVAPRQIPFHAGHHYFELDTRAGETWAQLESSGGLAIHVAGDFPGLELEFWAVRP